MIRTLRWMAYVIAMPVLAGMVATVHAQAYPSRPVTVIVPFAPGGNLDVITRVVTNEMSKSLGQPFVVENRPGAGGMLGMGRAAKAEPDGYTLVVTANGGYAYGPKLTDASSFAPADFIPVGMIGSTPLALEVHSESPLKDFASLVAQVKENPGGVSIGHPGTGTTNHIAILLLQQALGVKFNVIPYKGSGPALNDLLGRQIDVVVDQIPGSIQHLRGGALRALAVTSRQRAGDLPDVPTLQQEGLADFEVVTASGLLAPSGVEPAMIEVLNKALNDALKTPEVRDRLERLGTEVGVTTPEEFGSFLEDETRKADDLAKRGLLKAGG